ncbi:hypothetical protein PHISP_04993 [Aspergillus sp. HF37]|nr:hypothetical protein PHISP_04993 [Aspergillus sp. HF37]
MSNQPNPLNPISPDRLNQQTLANSPSLQTDLLNANRRTPKGGSDVQSKVAFLNNLSRGESPTPAPASSGCQNAALQRAILGREEAESALARASAELSESRSRERRISERVESLLEDLQTAKEHQGYQRGDFLKEVKKAKKEAFRAGSTLLKVQEELNNSRAEAQGLKDEVISEREAKENAKQEAFERTYALTGLTEELETLKGRLRSVEANNHSNTLEAQARRMHREEIGRMSLAEGDLAFLTTPRKPKRSAEDLGSTPVPDTTNPSSSYATPPKRQRVSDVMANEGGRDITTPETQCHTISDLQDDLAYERWRTADLESMIHFMKMECQFKACSCRLAEYQGETYVHDEEYAAKMNKVRAQEVAKNPEEPEERHVPVTDKAPRAPPVDASSQTSRSAVDDETLTKTEPNEKPMKEPLIAFSPATGTFRTIPSPSRDSVEEPQGEPMVLSRPVEPHGLSHIEAISRSHLNDSSKGAAKRHYLFHNSTSGITTPVQAAAPRTSAEDVKSRSQILGGQGIYDAADANEHPTTTTVPLRTEASSPDQPGPVPGTPVNREEALAQIRARRGRAHSTKRSVSASETTVRPARTGATPVRDARRIPGLHQQSATRSDGDLNERRDLSAPIRMFHR